MRVEALLYSLANLAQVDGVGGDTFFFNELLDLFYASDMASQLRTKREGKHTRSRVLAARSLTKGRAMAGTRCEAVRWPCWLLTRRSDIFNHNE